MSVATHVARMRGAGRRVGPTVVGLVLVGALFLAIFPTPAYLNQRRALDTAQTRLAVLSEENARLEARMEQLQSDEEIERLAREQFNLVEPGEEAFAILPPPEPTPGLDALATFLRHVEIWA